MKILDLIATLASEEKRTLGTAFLAPSVPGGSVRTRVAGMIYSFRREPQGFEGWGIFVAESATHARLEEEADPMMIDAYLRLFPRFRLRLAFKLRGRSWLAYPANESDMRQRFGGVAPVVVHLVERVGAFESVVARWDGAAWWFEELDRAADPIIAAEMRSALRAKVSGAELRIKGLTPEMRAAYEIAAGRRDAHAANRTRDRMRGDEGLLRGALERAGARLRSFHDQGELWLVEWSTADSAQHTTAVAKGDLTVVGAGICLSGRDRDFDLQSLVGVVEDRPEWMRGEG